MEWQAALVLLSLALLLPKPVHESALSYAAWPGLAWPGLAWPGPGGHVSLCAHLRAARARR